MINFTVSNEPMKNNDTVEFYVHSGYSASKRSWFVCVENAIPFYKKWYCSSEQAADEQAKELSQQIRSGRFQKKMTYQF
ncbi:hypothetical protein H7198_04045 [Fructobacillus sp. CRL 2054]|uniref:hypothetical protein n=1 Tax=Fructobacillus sp. CRL 2054 TaxID=2763007 RepID=UPI002379392E|nr:hypothetical protein [Fructobacillus sp. CRL 2054]MDD9138775.1 hypothetical protein [Fructobacillus sp. CRL 2054]